MRIAILKAGLFAGGGVRRVMESWARVLGAHGHSIVVLAERSESTLPIPEIPGVEQRDYPPPAGGGRFGRFRARCRAAVDALAALHREQPFDLVMTHESVTSPAVRRALPEVSILQTFHSPQVDENRLNNWKYTRDPLRLASYPATLFLAHRLDRAALEAIDWAHTLSDYTWGLLSARYPDVCDPARWSKVPGTFEDARFLPPADREEVRRSLGFEPDEQILFTVRALVARNAVERIFHCARELRDSFPRARYLIGGMGAMGQELRERAVREGVDDVVRFLGFVSEEELPAYYQGADAFLLPTRDLECFGLPVIEAMACGCTPLVTPVGGPAEVCAANHPDLVSKENSSRSFTDLVRRFLAGEIPRRPEALAAEARANFSEHAVAGPILEVVERVRRNARG